MPVWREGLGRDQAVDPGGATEEDPAVGRDLHRMHPLGCRQQHTRGAGEPGPRDVQIDRPDRPAVHIAEDEIVVASGPQAAAVAEGGARDADRRLEVGLGKVAWFRPGVVRARRLRLRARFVRAPPEVAPLDDEVDLVRALRAVLGLPEPVGLRIEANPNELRWPKDQMRPSGLPWAAVPSVSSRRILPRRLFVRSCAFAALCPSPITTYSL